MEEVIGDGFMRILKVAAFIVPLLLAGCVSPINWQGARQLRAGMTEPEVTALVGKPDAMSASGNGYVLIWRRYVNGQVQELAVPFKDGRVTAVPQVPSSF